jgi:hypothetical protein
MENKGEGGLTGLKERGRRTSGISRGGWSKEEVLGRKEEG